MLLYVIGLAVLGLGSSLLFQGKSEVAPTQAETGLAYKEIPVAGHAPAATVQEEEKVLHR